MVYTTYHLVWTVLAVLVGIFLYQDAKKTGRPNPLIWGVLGFFFSVVTLIVYFLTKESNKGTI